MNVRAVSDSRSRWISALREAQASAEIYRYPPPAHFERATSNLPRAPMKRLSTAGRR